MSLKVMIVGMGIGQLYEKVCKSSKRYKYDIITVDKDPNKKAMFHNISSALEKHPTVDMSIICLPNYLHLSAAKKLYEVSKVVLVEKPGFKTKAEWDMIFAKRNNIFMIKNNMFRKNIRDIHKLISKNKENIQSLNIKWLNANRIPNPGGWFTNKEFAFSGVSSDLVPHLLSIYFGVINEYYPVMPVTVEQRYTLKDIKSSDYGKVDMNGVYDVDDYCKLTVSAIAGFPTTIEASWKTPEIKENEIGLEIVYKDDTPSVKYDFGLCPESAYLEMIHYFSDMNSQKADIQNYIDCWIHSVLETIKNKFYGTNTILSHDGQP